jgi:hypothetical protein
VESARGPRSVEVHVRYVRARSKDDTDQFAGLLLRWAWPCGHDDHYDPLLAESLRRLPASLKCDERVICSCDAGRCALCN